MLFHRACHVRFKSRPRFNQGARLALLLAAAFWLGALGAPSARGQIFDAPEDAGGDSLESKLDSFITDTLATDDPMVMAAEGEKLAPAEAERLEVHLTLAPSDREARARLLGYYEQHSDTAKQRKLRSDHVLWVFEHMPESELAGSRYARLDPVLDDAASTRAVNLWLDAAQQHPRDLEILRNAGDFLMRLEPEQAAGFFTQAERVAPSSPEWPARLGTVYTFAALRKPAGQRKADGAKAVAAYQRALELAGRGEARAGLLADAAHAALIAGEPKQAAEFGKALCAQAAANPIAPDADALHEGRTLIGLALLESGDAAGAKAALADSAKVGGSRRLTESGPSMDLAYALARQGETQAVLDYLKACQSLWPRGADQLAAWSEELKAGRVPAEWAKAGK